MKEFSDEGKNDRGDTRCWMLVIPYQHRSLLIQILDAGYWMLGYAVQARNDRCGVQLKPTSQ
ncbi:MAG: hypothetical protein QF473_00315 [Planctomycetota bacterium]|nr:hypothetical protein [Planctomycetota bacterium]